MHLTYPAILESMKVLQHDYSSARTNTFPINWRNCSMKKRWKTLTSAVAVLRLNVQSIVHSNKFACCRWHAPHCESQWGAAIDALDCVLLPTSEHMFVCSRLNNSKTYLIVGEYYAAYWELVQASRRLRSLEKLHT